MKAVVDTNVIAYLLLGTEAFIDEARLCFEQVAAPLGPLTPVAPVTGEAVALRGTLWARATVRAPAAG